MTRPIDILQQDGRYTDEQVKAVEAAQPKLEMAMENLGNMRTEQLSETVQLAGLVKGLLHDVPKNAENLANQHYQALKANGAQLAGAFAQGTAYWREANAGNEMLDLISTGVAGSEDPRLEQLVGKFKEQGIEKPAGFRDRVSQPQTPLEGRGA